MNQSKIIKYVLHLDTEMFTDLFISHELDGRLWSYFDDIDAVSSPEGLDSSFLKHVFEPIDNTIFVLACSMHLVKTNSQSFYQILNNFCHNKFGENSDSSSCRPEVFLRGNGIPPLFDVLLFEVLFTFS